MNFFFPTVLFVLSAGFTFGQEITSLTEEVSTSEGIPDETYQNIVNDMCSCFNTATEGISDEMRKVIEDAGKNGTSLEEKITLYFESAANNVEDDIAILSGLGGDELMNCIGNLESKYQEVDIDNSEELLMHFFQKTDGCALTYAFILEGLKQ
ncbi:MAG: hypothetical protein ACJAUD_001153 [Crocinitomicaceae bacterium]|jgi:hypothetical protein